MKKLMTLVGISGFALAAAAMPQKSELKKVQSIVNEIMSADVQAMKAGRMTASKVAANAESYAREADTEAAKFLLLKGSFGLYMSGGSYDDALRVLNTLTSEIKDVPDKVIAEIVVAKLKKVSKNEGAAVFEYYERIERRMRLTDERAKLEKALKEHPTSKDANRDLAVCIAGLGDWPRALTYFAAAGGKEAEAAKAETSGKVSAADLWWDAAQGEAGEIYREHAAALYRAALDGNKLTGLGRTLAKKRVAEVGPAEELPAKKTERVAEARPEPAEKPSSPKRPVANVAVPKGSYDWSIPKNLSKVRTLDFDLGCAEKMTFFAVPPGTCEMRLTRWGTYAGFWRDKAASAKYRTTCKITHPFWVSQCNVTLEQYRSLGFECTATDIDKLAEACKGDKIMMAVFAPVTQTEHDDFFKEMNNRFGRQLPKGMVFRPMTLGERALFCFQPNLKDVKRFWGKAVFPIFDGELLAALHRKGFYTDCKDAKEMWHSWLFSDKGIVPYFALGYYMGDLRRQRIAADWLGSGCGLLLDRVALSHAVNPSEADRTSLEIAKGLGCGETVVDPFWYCDENEPHQVGPDSRWSCWHRVSGRDDHRPFYCIRVAVGYDYVGEWKRKHGK